ncbi:MAG: hypothetical protein Q4G58_17875 [bacterium]|nr:hypothetical protein [bacterium]
MISTKENLLLWEQRIDEANKSGMTIKDWCEKNGISKHKYSYWKHKIITMKEAPVEEVEFAEVTPIISEPDNLVLSSNKYDDFKLIYKDIQITVPNNFNKNSLAELMTVLQKL